jgi:hypothetical protein
MPNKNRITRAREGNKDAPEDPGQFEGCAGRIRAPRLTLGAFPGGNASLLSEFVVG